MKTAVSIPDELFEEAEKTAKKLGLPRSQFYARALQEYISRHDKAQITARLNSLYGQASSSRPPELGLEEIRESLKNDSW